MNIEQFEVFRTIAQAKSFTKAAKILNFTQPAISSQIKLLEQNYNVSLFERGNNGVKLTEAGKKFYEYGEKILALYAEMENEISKISGLNKEYIKIGASYSAGNYFLPSSIITFKEFNPNAYIRLDIGHTQDIINSIKERSLDFGVVDGDSNYGSELERFKIQSNRLVLIVPPTDQWREITSISIEDLMKVPFLAREEEATTRHLFNFYLKTLGYSLDDFNIVAEITNWEAIKEAVLRNLGVAIIPYPVVEREVKEERLLTVDIEEEALQLTWDVEVITRSNETLTGLKKAFVEFLTDPDAIWQAESKEILNNRMRFI